MLAAMFPRKSLLPVLLLAAVVSHAQNPSSPIEPNADARAANSDGVYLALRGALPTGDGATVKNFTMEREGGVFHFDQGEFYFYGPVNGKVTGAVFSGKGHFELAVNDPSEKRSFALLTKSGAMQQDFTTVVLRFTDATADEIHKASTSTGGGALKVADSAGSELAKDFSKRLHENLDLRLLQDVLATQPGGLFLASFRMGGALTGRNVLFSVDPEDAPNDVSLSTWSDDSYETWAAYPAKHIDKENRANRDRVTNEKLDVAFEKSGAMKSSAEVTLQMRRDGIRVRCR